MIQKTIDEWAKGYRFTQRASDQVHSLVQKFGVKLVTSVFEQMAQEAPIGTETRIHQFQRFSEDVIREHRREQSTKAFEKQYEENQAASEKAHKSGYRPTPEALRAQLDQMHDAGEISVQEYQWGLQGLETVFDLVDAAQSEPEPEMADVPF